MERVGKRNRFVKRTVAVLGAAFVLAGLVALSAQARGPGWSGRHKPSPDRVAARIAERLGLSADQKARVEEILTQQMAKRAEIREEGRRKMESLRAETEKRFAGVLTEEQMTKLRALREERRERRAEHRDGRGERGPRPGDSDSDFPGGPPPESN